MKLYTVTTVREENAISRSGISRRGKKYMVTHQRCVAVYSSLEKAKQIVEENVGDIYEYYYRWVVIEAVQVDWLYGGFDREEYWYEWTGDGETGSYISIEKPEDWENIINWGIG
jgi:hypothetical protein